MTDPSARAVALSRDRIPDRYRCDAIMREFGVVFLTPISGGRELPQIELTLPPWLVSYFVPGREYRIAIAEAVMPVTIDQPLPPAIDYYPGSGWSGPWRPGR